MKKERVLWFDLLRITAIMAVVFLHVASLVFLKKSITSSAWHVANIIDSMMRFCVPVLVMLSGALFLSNDKTDLKKLYGKNILRLFIAYIVWNLVYSIYVVAVNKVKVSLVSFLVFRTPVATPLWYLPMIIGLYIITPLVKPIFNNRKTLEYYLIIFVSLGIVLPFVCNILNIFLPKNTIVPFIYPLKTEMVGYLGYYALGYYLYKFQPFKKYKALFALGYVLSVIGCIIGTIWLSNYLKEANTLFYNYFSLTTFISSVCVFCTFAYIISQIKIANFLAKIMVKFSYYTFGIYLIHWLVIIASVKFYFDLYMTNVIISIPLLAIIAILISLIMTIILSKIPLVNKYLV